MNKFGFLLFSIFAIFLVELKFSEGAVVCHNVDVRNGIKHFDNLRNCTTISGFLKILLIENTNSSDFENVSFPELTDIRGYLLFYKVTGLTSLEKLFPNLSAIRGLTLFLDYYSFIIYDCKDMKNIGLHNLKYIERGATRIGKCPKLCYVHTLDWSKIGHPSHHLYFDNEKENCTQKCPEKCKGCWNENHCQISDDKNCHSECIRCTGPGANECKACKLYIDNQTCVSSCPNNKILHTKLGRCLNRDQCNSTLIPGPWKLVDNKCIHNSTRKLCNSTLIDSMDAVRLFRQCTHINGSLSIRVTALNSELELSKSLSSIEEISGYLKIYRSTLVNLDFLRNLRTIHGKELYNQQYSVIVYENPNLQKLWNWNEFGINIKRGNISFHYNSQLCPDEIQNFGKAANITYDEFDVSPFSNGHKQACEYIDLNVSVETNATNATLLWNNYTITSQNVSLIGYLLYYIQDPFSNMTIYNERDECEDNSWESAFVTNINHTLLNLNPYTTYAYYVKIYTSSSLEGGRTAINRFKTKTSDPELVDEMQAKSYSFDTVILNWKPPVFKNGKITHHSLAIYVQDDDLEFIAERNYCKFPHVFTHEDIPVPSTESTPKLEPKEDCCEATKKDAIDWISNFCSKMDLISPKLKSCKDYMYSVENVKKTERQDKFVTQNSRSMIKPSYPVLEKIIPEGSITTYNVTNLTYFTVYIFLVQACIGTSHCSAVMYASERTMSKPEADDIPPGCSVTVVGKNWTLNWSEPKHPNSVIVSYYIEYQRVGYKNSSSDCITKQTCALLGFKYTKTNFSTGRYTVRIRAVSLAGPGNFSEFVNFEIGPEAHEMSIELVIVLTVVFILLIVAGLCYYRYNNNVHRKPALDELNLMSGSTFDVSGPTYVEDEWEIDRDDVEILFEIGRGSFGGVYSGIIKSKQLSCAVKVASGFRNNVYEKLSFLNEASFMKSFNTSSHVVKLLGIVSRGQVPMVLVELMARGDLKTYLRQRKRSLNGLTSSEMYRMAAQIADGMMYLKSRKYIHRDLAARNCMVSSDLTVKIGDIGISKDVLYEADYYKIESGSLMPVRWMAPESLTDGVFTSDSDVWSYGIVLWEIVTFGEQPYQELSNGQVIQFVISEGTLERPRKCPDLLYEIMSVCWKRKPSLRPTFTDVVEKLEMHVGQHFRLVSFYHSSEGDEWKLNNKNRTSSPATFPEPFDINRAVHWDTSFDDISI